MKIIAYTTDGYIAEVSNQEMQSLTGEVEYYNEKHKPGTELKLIHAIQHIDVLRAGDENRQRIVDSLRAAATLIENTPKVLADILPEAADQAVS
jgi:hypothetical protein